MCAANVILLTPVLDPKGVWNAIWLHGAEDVTPAAQLAAVRLPGLQIYAGAFAGLATGIHSLEQLAAAKSTGATAFAGSHISHPAASADSKQNAGRAILLHLLALVTQDADTAEIEKVFRHEPGLSFHLFRLVNSPGMGLSTKISSFNQAIMVLGRRQLQRWVQLLLYASSSEAGGSPLLAFAAMRGHLLEKLAGALGRDAGMREQAFMTGIFSLLDSLLGMSLAEIAKTIPLPDAVQSALLERQGELGQLLDWMEAVQAGDEPALPPGLSAEQCVEAQLDALSWALDVGAGMAQGTGG